MGKRGRPRKITRSNGEAEEGESGHHHLTPTISIGGIHQQATNPISSPLSTKTESLEGKITMEKRGSGRLRKGTNGEAEEAESGHLTPAGANVFSHQNAPNLIPPPPGFLSLPTYYPPAPSRLPRRHGKATLGQCAALTTPSRYTLRSATVTTHDPTLALVKKILAEKNDGSSPRTEDIPTKDNVTSKLAIQTQVSNNPAASSRSPSQHMKSEDHSQPYYKWLARTIETTGNLNKAMSLESGDWSIPTGNYLMDIEMVTSDLHQSQGQEELHPAAAPSPPQEETFHDHLSNRGATETLNILGNGQEVSAKNLGQNVTPTQSVSINLTVIAAMSYDDSSDDEVRSALDAALVTVNGYRVKEEFASLLREIFSKYGDIAKDSSLKSLKSRSSFLEMVCGIFQKLQGTKFTEITPTDLKSMRDLISDIESVRLEVGWLRKRVEDINEAKLLMKGSSSLKYAKTRISEDIGKTQKELEGYRAELLMVQDKICSAEDMLAALKLKSEEINEAALDMKTKVKCFYQRSLIDGLL